MTTTLKRRSVLLGMGHAAALGTLATALPRAVQAGQAPAGPAPAPMKICLSMVYPAGDGLSFDADAFRDRHMALLKNVYGNSVDRIELRVAPPPPPPPPVVEGEPAPPMPAPPPILAAVSIWIANVGEFVKRVSESGKKVSEDMATITRSAPMVQFDVLEGEVGGSPGSVLGGGTVLSYYFFAKEDGTWDGSYFGKEYLPKLMAAYGSDAVLRAEVSRGEQGQGGAKALIAGAIHVYLKDPAAYDAAVEGEAAMALGAEAQQHSTINPVPLVMTVHATG